MLSVCSDLKAQGTVISENDTFPHPSAILDVSSTTKGFLAPRMNSTQVAAIVDPAEGLIVYQTDLETGYYIFENSSWEKMIHKAAAAVPIGAVIDWWRPDASFSIPEGYAICDGTQVIDAASPFNGSILPDLNEKFVRGTTDTAEIGIMGGANTHSHTTNPAATATTSSGNHLHSVDPPAVSTSSVASHSHSVNPASTLTSTAGSHTHAIDPPSTPTSSDSHNHRWSYLNTSSDWYSFTSNGTAQLVVNWGDGMDSNGEGYFPFALQGQQVPTFSNYTDNDSHSHFVNTGSFSSSNSGNHFHSFDVPSTNSTSAGGHNHSVNVPTVNSSSAGTHAHSVNIPATASSISDHQPSYFGLLKLMRIR